MNKKLINLGALAIIALGGSVLATTGNAQEPLAPGDGDGVAMEATCTIGDTTVSGSSCTSNGTTCTCS